MNAMETKEKASKRAHDADGGSSSQVRCESGWDESTVLLIDVGVREAYYRRGRRRE